MAFRTDAPTIPLSDLQWDAIGEHDPKSRLLAHIRIGSLDMHLEAREIAAGTDMQQTIDYPEDHEAMSGIADCAFETLEIDGREYFLFALPYGQ